MIKLTTIVASQHNTILMNNKTFSNRILKMGLSFISMRFSLHVCFIKKTYKSINNSDLLVYKHHTDNHNIQKTCNFCNIFFFRIFTYDIVLWAWIPPTSVQVCRLNKYYYYHYRINITPIIIFCTSNQANCIALIYKNQTKFINIYAACSNYFHA